MKKTFLLLTLSLLSASALATQMVGTIQSGGGVDDLFLEVTANGKTIHGYCDGACGDWFDEDAKTDVRTLKKKFVGHRIQIEYRLENNRDRIAGPGANENLYFIKKATLLP